MKDIYHNIYALLKLCIERAAVKVTPVNDILVYAGQGEGVTK
jgi:hypothetical protein